MISGQVVSVADSFIISITGICIVMAELGLLALFVMCMSKVLAPFSRNKEPLQNAAQAVASNGQANQPASSEDEDELAAIMAVVCEESGLNPDEFVIKSIQQIK